MKRPGPPLEEKVAVKHAKVEGQVTLEDETSCPSPSQVRETIAQLAGTTAPLQDADITQEEAAQYDRQIRLWGFDAQKRLRNARVLVITLSGLTNEVCKNLVLAGVGSLTVADAGKVAEKDVGSQFLLSEDDVGKPRASAMKQRLQVLNPRVQIHTIDEDILRAGSRPDSFFQSFHVVCLISGTLDQITRLDQVCRAKNIKFWSAGMAGLHGYIFSDMGQHHYTPEKKDASSTETKQVLYPSFQDCCHKKWASMSLKKCNRLVSPVYFAVMGKELEDIVILAILEFQKKQSLKHVSNLDEKTMTSLIKYKAESIKNKGIDPSFLPDDLFKSICTTFGVDFAPACAIVGGILSQEILKCISAKDVPIKNFFCFNGLDHKGLVIDLE